MMGTKKKPAPTGTGFHFQHVMKNILFIALHFVSALHRADREASRLELSQYYQQYSECPSYSGLSTRHWFTAVGHAITANITMAMAMGHEPPYSA